MKRHLVFAVVAAPCFLSQVQGQLDVTSPGDPITGGQTIGGVFIPATQGTPVGNANMFPPDSTPAFAIDNGFASKYRNFGEANTGFVVTPFFNRNNGGTFVTALRFGTGDNSPERDPLTYTLEGTAGDPFTGTYTRIASGSTGLDTDPGRATFGPVLTFPGVGAYTSYRVIFPTVRNSAIWVCTLLK